MIRLRARAALPLPSSTDVRVLFASLLVAAHLGDGVEPAIRGLAADRMVRFVGAAAGWASSFAAVLGFAALGFFVVRSVLVARASFGRSLLTGATAAASAFALTAIVAGHAGPPSRVLLASLVLAVLGARAVAGPTFARLLPAVVIATFGVANVLAARAFEQGGLELWVGARVVSTVAWGALVVLATLVVRSVEGARRGVGVGVVLAVGMAAGLLSVLAESLGEGAGFVRSAIAHGALGVPPFGLGEVPRWAPTVLRFCAWASLVFLPTEALGLPVLSAFLPALPAPLAAVAVLLGCHVEAAGVDDDATAP